MQRALIGIVALIGCGERARPAAAPPAPKTITPAAPDSFVLVWNHIWLADTIGGANRARMSDDTSQPGGGVFVMRVIEDRGATLEVETVDVDDRDQHCYWGFPELDRVRLRFALSRTDLVWVTVREVSFELPDGTGGTVRAGVAVGPPQARREVNGQYRGVAVPLDDGDVGVTYQPTAQLDADVELVFGGPSVTADAALHIGEAAVWRAHSLYYTAQETTAGGLLVTLPDACLSLRALTTADAVLPADDDADFELSFDQTPWMPFEVESGATIYWPDGRVAGTTIESIQLVAADGVADGRPCYQLSLRKLDADGTPSPDSVLRVCFDPGVVVEL